MVFCEITYFVKGEKVEKVGNFTKDHISDNKIYFTENLPTYIPFSTFSPLTSEDCFVKCSVSFPWIFTVVM
jgi:hypothetical protein